MPSVRRPLLPLPEEESLPLAAPPRHTLSLLCLLLCPAGLASPDPPAPAPPVSGSCSCSYDAAGAGAGDDADADCEHNKRYKQ